jgi:hypothetical protein
MSDKKSFLASIKSSDTEERIDMVFYRPIGFLWARFFRMLGVTPNTVTVLSIILGMAAGVCFGFDNIKINIVGILLLVWANMYDSADGQLARMTGQTTPLGRILDGASSDFWFATIYAAVAIRVMPEWGIWIWLVVAFAGLYSHTRQCRVSDYYRQIHLFFLNGKEGCEMDDASVQVDIYRNMSWKEQPVQKFFQFFYVNYTKEQEKATPCFQRFRVALRQRFPEQLPEQLCCDFRRGSFPLMKFCNFLTFNWRSFTLFTSLLIGKPWVYPVVEITVFEVVCRYMRYRHEKLSREMLAKLDSYQ